MPSDQPPLEEMGSFFDARAGRYDTYMRDVIRSFDVYYATLAAPIPATDAPLRVLDLGCGTGLELAGIWARAPQARVTGVDLSAEMLARLRERYAARAAQLELVQGSYLAHPLGEGVFDVAVSSMTMHHLPPEQKAVLYARLRRCLRPGGLYVEGDYVVDAAEEVRLLRAFREATAADAPGTPQRHLDAPASLATQEALLAEAGFTDFRLRWREGEAAIYSAVAAEPPA